MKKEACKNLKGWANRIHKKILGKHILPYSNCLELDWHAEESCLSAIKSEYHFHIHWHLQDHEEPQHPLRYYNPHAPSEVEVLTAEEAKEKQERIDELNQVGIVLAFRLIIG